MSMNEIYETLQGISLSDISAVLSRLDESGHALTQAEIIGLAAAAAAGLRSYGSGQRSWDWPQVFLSVLPRRKPPVLTLWSA